MKAPVLRVRWPSRPGHAAIEIRPVDAADTEGLRSFYADLSAESRRARFLGSRAGLSEHQCRSFCGVDHEHREGFVAVLAGAHPRDGEIVGHACLEPSGERDGAEIAVAVADAFQGQGIGRALVRVAAGWARRRGLRELRATAFASNARILGLLRSFPFSARLREADAGIVELVIPLDGEPLARAA